MIELINEIKMECRCDYCHSIWSYQEEDIEKVDYDAKGIYCPKCGSPIVVEKIDPIKFPDAFYHFGASSKAKVLPNETINEMIKDCINGLKNDDESMYYMNATGDTMVIAMRLTDEEGIDGTVSVCKNYWETEFKF